MAQERVVVSDEAVVHIVVVGEVEVRVKVVVELVPRVFDEGDGYVAEGVRVGTQSQLHEFAGRCDIAIAVIAGPENTCLGTMVVMSLMSFQPTFLE